MGAAREEGEGGPHVARRVVERAPQRQLLVVEPVRVDAELRAGLAAAEVEDGAAGADELQRSLPRVVRAGSFDHDIGALAVAGRTGELGDEGTPLRTAADDLGPPAGVGDARAQHQADRPRAEDRDPVAGLDCRPFDTAQAAGERLDHRRDLGREPGGTVSRLTSAIAAGTTSSSAYAPLRSASGAPRSSPAAELAATTRLPVATSIPQNSCPNGLGSSRSRTGGRGGTSSGRCRR